MLGLDQSKDFLTLFLSLWSMLKVASCTGTGEIAVRDTVEEPKGDVKEESDEKIVAR